MALRLGILPRSVSQCAIQRVMRSPRHFLNWLRVLAVCLLTPTACRKSESSTAPLPQWAYVWQREWSSSVTDALNQSATKLDGFIVLGAEISWRDGQPQVLRPPIEWSALQKTGKRIGIAIRINPFPDTPSARKEHAPYFSELAASLIQQAHAHGVECEEFQVDYDAPEKRLAEYRSWLAPLRETVKPARLVITALPSWLNESEAARLFTVVDSFVLQVHSVPTRNTHDRVALCEPERAKRWIAQAAQFQTPFTVAIPTYSALVGYDQKGRSLGMATDGVQPKWPSGTSIVEFDSDPAEMALLVATLHKEHPSAMNRIAWYRLPVDGKRNWRWPTFSAIVDGRQPSRELDVVLGESNPVDISLLNRGESEERLDMSIIVRWTGLPPVTCEALRGWRVSQAEHEARFQRTPGPLPRLLPGARREIGWLRFDASSPKEGLNLKAEITR